MRYRSSCVEFWCILEMRMIFSTLPKFVRIL
nr:MAG TPA: hypothetical protein [Caudoviricetes sp.]